MRRCALRHVSVLVVLAVIGASCGKDRESAAPTIPPPDTALVTQPSGVVDTTSTTEPAPAAPMFGDAPWPCGPGDGANTDSGSEPGVTADSIRIAGGDDAGFAGSPGLSHEVTQTMQAMVDRCNELGGINGRTITFNYFDAKIFEVGVAMQGACDGDNFFLVGEGWAFDVLQEETRLSCSLPAVPTYSASAAFAHGKDTFQAVPNPADEMSAGFFEEMATIFPEQVKHVVTLVGAFSATQDARDKAIAAGSQFGWGFVDAKLEYNPQGESDWTPFVKQVQESGATMLYWSGTCLPHLQLFVQAAKANGLDLPIATDANHYAKQCADANVDGTLDKVYMRLTSTPFEEVDTNKATQDYVDLMTASGGDVALLGTQAASSFLLWATASSQCGAELTRGCAIANLRKITSWTGHGLHTETNPGQNHPATCNLIVKLKGTTYVRVSPAERGTFTCKDNWIAKVADTPALLAARLDASRISQQFSGG